MIRTTKMTPEEILARFNKRPQSLTREQAEALEDVKNAIISIEKCIAAANEAASVGLPQLVSVSTSTPNRHNLRSERLTQVLDQRNQFELGKRHELENELMIQVAERLVVDIDLAFLRVRAALAVAESIWPKKEGVHQ